MRLLNALQLPLFAATLLVSSGLMFLLEPMFARMVLPLLGGTPAVWNTCMAFFQFALLAGYAFAHASIRLLGVRRQAWLQLTVLFAAFLVLPIAIPHGWKPSAQSNPFRWLCLLLTVAVGLPFFAISTTGPVLQRWFASTSHKSAADPYFLYAASNIGSIAALLAYPVLIEPTVHLATQSQVWTVGFGLLIILTAICALFTVRAVPESKITSRSAPITFPRRARWILLAFIPSSLLLGVTAFMTSDIAAVPLFWIVPLALYLLSFIFVFSRRSILPAHSMTRALPLAILGVAFFMLGKVAQPIGLVLLLHLAALFFAAMVCHGALAKDRPSADRLTDFYLTMSLGGVLGGLFNALLAPLIFHSAAEYPIVLVLACLVLPAAKPAAHMAKRWIIPLIPLLAGGFAWWATAHFQPSMHVQHNSLRMVAIGLPIFLAVVTIRHRWAFAATIAALFLVAASSTGSHGSTLLASRRSFFGIHRIMLDPAGPFNDLYHGTTLHGLQRTDPAGNPIAPQIPGTYYYPTGPIGQLFNSNILPPHPRIALVGLGVGSLAAYANPGDDFTYYEIDPTVRWIADDSGYFTFIQSARQRGATINIILGDARLTLASRPDHAADLIVLDAFSGDAVPVHLLTREAVQIYLAKLTPHGLLAFHTSNMYLDLLPLLAAQASAAHAIGYYQSDLDLTPAEAAAGKRASQWVIMARDPSDLGPLLHSNKWQPLPPSSPSMLWTDDYSNLLSLFRWR